MRVLLTDAASTAGRLLARQLLAAGHTVSGVAASPHECLDPNVDFVRASLRDPVLVELAAEADAVIHLAAVDTSAPGGAGVSGVAHVAHAAARAGARLLFVSQAAGRAELYRSAETLVTTGWAPSLVIRTAPLLGRQLDWMVCRTVATLMRAKISARPIRVLHLDDLVRFLVLAVSTDRTGVVDLATPDTTNVITAWRTLRSVDPRLRLHGAPGWDNLVPDLDIAAAQEDWQFEYGWGALDAVVDTGRGLVGRKLGPAGATVGSGRLPLPVETAPRRPSTEGMGGEFDDRIDPSFPVFSAAGLAESLPGPLTPITLDVQMSGLRAAGQAMSRVLALGDLVADEWARSAIAVFGHRPYVGVSANLVAAAQLPGWDEHALDERDLGAEQPVDELSPPGRPPGGQRSPVAKAVVAARSLSLLRHLRTDTQAYVEAVSAEHIAAGDLAGLPDAALEVRLRLLRDRIHQGWILTALWVIDSGITAATLKRTSARARVSGLAAIMESDHISAQTEHLTGLLRADSTLCALAREGNVDSIRALSPAAAAALDAALAQLGHRGRGEAELASPAFSDEPGLLLALAAENAESTTVSPPSPDSLPHRLARNARHSRELAHDATIRFTHLFRMTLRELGSRRVAADLMDTVDDVYYLLCDELISMPVDARLRIKRRRAERERLQAQHPPDIIDHTWTPVE
ncbi:NAD-dependent epimerase/dehydratase family protein [Mycobacterium asiaticum]|uniref:NAD-dependent epimerase/dehydratase domain-containing protein n=1 Tax=Mycobacterium asiaticum TaxID=1790 RepID=A0A1A3MQ73_MYCAS|nr:NAD-dependent epimerase/dehydratase family protein [Mycobacterium asiaticum]OBK10332.1 hypothetical protein A5636_15290 [Mycobacterium asiaticum]